ncbi:disease resistance protein RGA2-like [Impatiens glandulifera]|uniref:disease resistance protein RGA2-like n=1 Tax=Impatiens glandulifera TaxID=253017 RepID=UPI001FB0C192|nr:disease resistance protein RGA2-like [Impatiens glandulifera]
MNLDYNEIWEISLNEESILPILKLSYYDLPYCAIFPKDTVIQKEKLVQMWMAHGLIPTNENQEVEDVGNAIWNELCWRSFFEDERNNLYRYEILTTCKMHDLMHDLSQSVMKDKMDVILWKLRAQVMALDKKFVTCGSNGKKERHCQLDELKALDIGGSLKIKNLGRVSDTSIARGVSMAKKSSTNKLELEWTSDDNESKSICHDKIGEALEVSTTMLKILRMHGYKGVNLPKWMGDSSNSLIHLDLYDMENVKHIFTINHHMNTSANSDDNGMTVLFLLLEILGVSHMINLRELVSPPIPSIAAFPNLCKMYINNCPNLRTLLPHLKSLKDLMVSGKCSDELLYSISNLSGLTRLSCWMEGKKCFICRSCNA